MIGQFGFIKFRHEIHGEIRGAASFPVAACAAGRVLFQFDRQDQLAIHRDGSTCQGDVKSPSSSLLICSASSAK